MSEIRYPDEAGWYWYKKGNAAPILVLVTEDGVGLRFDAEGYSRELNDLYGEWEVAEPNEL